MEITVVEEDGRKMIYFRDNLEYVKYLNDNHFKAFLVMDGPVHKDSDGNEILARSRQAQLTVAPSDSEYFDFMESIMGEIIQDSADNDEIYLYMVQLTELAPPHPPTATARGHW